MDDARLVELVAHGDEDAFRLLVERHKSAAYNFFLRLSGSVEDAEDLTQELFLKIYGAASRYRPEAPFRAYLYRIASNMAMSHLRKRKLRQGVSLEEMREAGVDIASERRSDDPAAVFEGQEAGRKYLRALSRLPAQWRLAIELRAGRELSVGEIAAAMGRSPSAVESILFRARERIAEEMQK